MYRFMNTINNCMVNLNVILAGRPNSPPALKETTTFAGLLILQLNMIISAVHPVAKAATEALRAGDIAALKATIKEYPGIVTSYIGDATEARTLLHILADWPGHFPNSCEAAETLIASGADVNAPFKGKLHAETPLHWAASTNDVALLDTLLDHGANIDAEGGVIDKTPLADARAFLQFEAANRLIDRGATATLQDLATLGLLDEIKSLYKTSRPSGHETNCALWNACHGGQSSTAQFLHQQGGDLHFVPSWEESTPLDAAKRSGAASVVEWLQGLDDYRI